MKKLISLFFLLLTCAFAFQSCSDSKSYAEMLEEEKDAINKFIQKNNIKVISASEFEQKGNKTSVAENEYVQLSNGVYMQIVEPGTGTDSIKNRDVITVRFVEYDIIAEDTTYATNYIYPLVVDVFDYTVSGTYASGEFRQGMMFDQYESATVPKGWLAPLQYIKSGARVKVIVPSKEGHSYAAQQVYPYFYDFRRITVW